MLGSSARHSSHQVAQNSTTAARLAVDRPTRTGLPSRSATVTAGAGCPTVGACAASRPPENSNVASNSSGFSNMPFSRLSSLVSRALPHLPRFHEIVLGHREHHGRRNPFHPHHPHPASRQRRHRTGNKADADQHGSHPE